ncbi:MAG: T9SS type A sorting domain-containing protein [Balneolales bacterium]
MKKNKYYKKNTEPDRMSPRGDVSGVMELVRRGLMLGITLFLTVFMVQNASAQENIAVDEGDSLALVAFYHATDGKNWDINSGWLTSDPLESWHGIYSVEEVEEGEWRVTRIDLRDNGLTGSFPEDMEAMDWLWRMEVTNNQMSGPFPDVLLALPRMRFPHIAQNFFSGEINWETVYGHETRTHMPLNNNYFEGVIPDIEEGDMPRTIGYNFANNRMSGDLPSGLEHLQNLRAFQLQGNKLTGDINELQGLAQVESLERFRIEYNYGLTAGPIPDWIGDMGDFLRHSLGLAGTNRTGEIPQWIGNMSVLPRLYLGGGDEIGGELPESMAFMESLQELDISNADFEGPIPEWIGQLPALTSLHLSDNDFTGTVPSSLNGSGIANLTLSDLALEGPLPDLGGMSLQNLTIDNPGFEMTDIPSWIGDQTSLESLHLTNLGITGDLPEFLSNLTALNEVSFDDNEITGEIPSWINDLEELIWFSISRTNMDISEVPSWLANHEDLEYIGLGGLGLSGTIPGFLGDLPMLTTLALDDNQFTGQIPNELGNLAFMDSLNLANNKLEGTIPSSLTDMGQYQGVTNLSALVLSGNENLTGDLPMEFTNWNPDVMRVLWFDGTGLCAPDDGAFSEWLDQVAIPYDENDPITLTSVRRTDECKDTSIDPDQQPNVFRLNQNYPNPFNPTTNISYQIPSETHVTLDVYDVLGQKVATLVNEQKNAGQYEVNFDAAKLASGTYIYRLKAGERTQTQTMMLIK